jgi:hypothetical protein
MGIFLEFLEELPFSGCLDIDNICKANCPTFAGIIATFEDGVANQIFRRDRQFFENGRLEISVCMFQWELDF